MERLTQTKSVYTDAQRRIDLNPNLNPEGTPTFRTHNPVLEMSLEEIESHIGEIINGLTPTDEHEKVILRGLHEHYMEWGHFTMVLDRGTHIELEIQFQHEGKSVHLDIRPNADNTLYEIADVYWINLSDRAKHTFYTNGGAKGHRIDY